MVKSLGQRATQNHFAMKARIYHVVQKAACPELLRITAQKLLKRENYV